MSAIPHLVGMVHLLPLPGSPGHTGSLTDVIDAARSDAHALAESGFPAMIVENFGDVPFYSEIVPAETVATMSRVVHEVLEETGLTVGVNVLRNDANAALAVAAATGARFVRVNVLTGVMYTDQGAITGKAAVVLRNRARLAPDVEIWADVMVKHAVPPHGSSIEQTAADTVERGCADAIIVSGPETGAWPDIEETARVRAAIPKDTRLAVGSGATAENLSSLTDVADTVIVGSSLKYDGDARNRVDPARARRFVVVAREQGLL